MEGVDSLKGAQSQMLLLLVCRKPCAIQMDLSHAALALDSGQNMLCGVPPYQRVDTHISLFPRCSQMASQQVILPFKRRTEP